MLILTTEQIFLSLGMRRVCSVTPTPKCSRPQREAISREADAEQQGEAEAWSGMQMPTGREPTVWFERPGAGASRAPEDLSGERAASPGAARRLTLGVSLLECVAGVHEAGGRVMFALELQVQLGRLAESVSGSWNRKE